MNDIELRDNFPKALIHYASTVGPTPTLPIANYKWAGTRYNITGWYHSSTEPTDEILKTYTVSEVNSTYSLFETHDTTSTNFNGYHITLSREGKGYMKSKNDKWKTMSKFIFNGTKSGFVPVSIKCAMNVTTPGSIGYCRIYDVGNVKEIVSFNTNTLEPKFEIIKNTNLSNLPENETIMSVEIKIEGKGYINIGDIMMLF